MTGASLGYSGSYDNGLLNGVGIGGAWWSSIIHETINSYALGLDMYDHDYPQASYNKRFGRAVRYVNQTWHTDLATQRRVSPMRLLLLCALNRRVLPISRA